MSNERSRKPAARSDEGASVAMRRRVAEIESRFADRLPCFPSELHGLNHLRKVAMLAGRIAEAIGADVESAIVAGLLHDCGRTDDRGGNGHALVSAALARPLLKELFPHLDAEAICRAIERHADGEVTADPISAALWDADRLTIGRAGYAIRQDLLSTEAAKRLATIATSDCSN